MKRLLFVLGVVGTIVILGTGFVKKSNPAPETEKKICTGYVVIEAGKGVDCNGDTIRLIKRNGFFEVATDEIMK